jgi:hypothetical protein
MPSASDRGNAFPANRRSIHTKEDLEMASLWQRKKTGVWYVTYRENGKQRARFLRTKDKREAP